MSCACDLMKVNVVVGCLYSNGTTLWARHRMLQINQHMCPAALRWQQGFNELKEKLYIQCKVTDTVRITHIKLETNADNFKDVPALITLNVLMPI